MINKLLIPTISDWQTDDSDISSVQATVLVQLLKSKGRKDMGVICKCTFYVFYDIFKRFIHILTSKTSSKIFNVKICSMQKCWMSVQMSWYFHKPIFCAKLWNISSMPLNPTWYLAPSYNPLTLNYPKTLISSSKLAHDKSSTSKYVQAHSWQCASPQLKV